MKGIELLFAYELKMFGDNELGMAQACARFNKIANGADPFSQFQTEDALADAYRAAVSYLKSGENKPSFL